MAPDTGRTLCFVLYLALGPIGFALAGAYAQTRPVTPTGYAHSAVPGREQAKPTPAGTQTRPAAGIHTRPATTVPKTRPARANPTTRPAGAIARPLEHLEQVQVSFATKDNFVIAGTYTPPPRKTDRAPMVILLHMYGSDGSAFDPLVPGLHAAGFAVLAIDFRGHGRSIGPPEMRLANRVAERDKKLFSAMDRDVEAACGWLSRQPGVDPARFVLVGASLGSSIALKYAARDRSVDGVACLTPGALYLGLDSLADARKYGQRPLLLIASEEERSPCDELGRAARAAIVQIVPAADSHEKMALHGTGMLGRAPNVERTIMAFLLRAAGPAGAEPVLASIQGKVYHPATRGNSGQISPDNIRWFSSAEEAESRGLRPTKASASRGRGASIDGDDLPKLDTPASIRR